MPHYMELTPLLATLLLFLCCSCEPEYRAKCSNNTETITSMTPSDDGVQSRYTVEWCTNLKEHDTVWNLELAYNRRNPKACDNKNQHSTKTIHLHDLKLNCSQVCLSTDLDLIFSTCYRVQSLLPSRGSLRDVSTHNISNNYTLDTFKNATYEGNIVNHGDYVSAHFFLGIIPVTSFDVELCKKTNNSCHGYCECMDVKRNCSATVSTQRHEVECRVPAPPGFYELRMRHLAPWASSDFASDKRNMHLSFSVQRPTDVRAPDVGAVGGGALAAAALAALLALAAAAGLLLALRRGRARRLRAHVLTHWLHRQEESKPASVEAESSKEPSPILLLYAREGPAAQPCVAALTRLLETVAPGQVLDLYSSRAVSLMAGAPAQWLRALLARGTRVLLLQTPALQALHVPRLPPAPHSPQLEQPLLGRRGVYRAPACADELLPLALTLAGAAPAPYAQYYLGHAGGAGDGGAAALRALPPLRAAAARARAAAGPGRAGRRAAAAAGRRPGPRRAGLRGPRARAPRLPHGRAHLHLSRPPRRAGEAAGPARGGPVRPLAPHAAGRCGR